MNKKALFQHIKKYKIWYHIALGLISLTIGHFFFKWLIDDNLFWVPNCIVAFIVAAIAEKTQDATNTGTSTAQGMARTCIPLLPYAIYQSINMIF